MRFIYGTNDSTPTTYGRTATPQELAERIKSDIASGKWNSYNGGTVDSTTATCRFHRPGYTYHNRLYIYGDENEFKQLEKLIEPIMLEFTPRQFKGGN